MSSHQIFQTSAVAYKWSWIIFIWKLCQFLKAQKLLQVSKIALELSSPNIRKVRANSVGHVFRKLPPYIIDLFDKDLWRFSCIILLACLIKQWIEKEKNLRLTFFKTGKTFETVTSIAKLSLLLRDKIDKFFHFVYYCFIGP